VRLALSHAWNPQALRLIFQDYVLPTRSLLPQGLMADEPGKPVIEFSPDKAKALMRQVGSGRGIRLEMVLHKEDWLLFQLFSLYAKNLKRIGIQLTLTRLERSDFARKITRGDYDLAHSGWIADYPDPDSMLHPLLSEALQREGYPNLFPCQKQDFQKRLTLARQEGDATKRQDMYRAIDRAMIGEGLIIPLYQDKRVIIFNPMIGLIRPNPMGKICLFDIQAK